MSKSYEVHKQTFPYCHPSIKTLPPSRAAKFVVKTYPKRERSQQTIVDAGCGEGRDTLFLLGEGFHVVAIDASERNLDILYQKVVEARASPDMFSYHTVDLLEKIPIESATVDVVLDVWVLGSVILPHDGRTGAKQYLAEVYRILKPDGLFISEFETIRPRRSAGKLKEYFANLMKGHFSIIESKTISADYALYLDVPHQGKVNSALFVVACKQQ